MENNKSTIAFGDYLTIILLSLAFAIFTLWPLLSSYYIIEDDLRLFYYFPKFWHPNLFPYDFFSETCRNVFPAGIRYLYYILLTFLNLISISKLLSFTILILSGVLSLVISFRIGGRFAAYFGFFLFMLVFQSDNLFSTGTMRLFAYPGLLLFIYGCFEKKKYLIMLSFIGTAFLYPTHMGIMLIFLLIDLIKSVLQRDVKTEVKVKIKIIVLVISISGLIALGNVVWKYGYQKNDLISYQELISLPETGSKGHDLNLHKFFDYNPAYILSWEFINNQFFNAYYADAASPGWEFTSLFLLVIFLIVILKFIFRANPFRAATYYLFLLIILYSMIILLNIWSLRLIMMWFISSLALGIHSINPKVFKTKYELKVLLMSSVFMFLFVFLGYRYFGMRFYLAPHNFRYSLPIFLVLFIVENMGRLWAKIKWEMHSLWRVALLLMLMVMGFAYGLKYKPALITLSADEIKAVNYIKTLPLDVTVAGFPYFLDTMALYSERAPLVSYELGHCWVRSYWQEVKKRFNDDLKLLYANNEDDICTVCNKYNKLYILVDNYYYSKEFLSQEKLIMEPFDSYIRSLVHDKKPYFLKLPDEKKEKNWGNIFIVNCNSICNH